MSNIAFTILLLITIVLAINDALCIKQIRDLTRELRSYQNSVSDELAGIKTKSKAQDKILVELAHAVNTLSAQEALLNNKTSKINIRLEQINKQIKLISDECQDGTEI